MTSLRHDVKLMYSWLQIGVLAALWALVGLAYAEYLGRAPAAGRTYGLTAMLEAALPLLSLFSVGHVASLEWEEGTIELSLSYPGGGLDLLLRRLGVGLLFFLSVEAATLGVFRVAWPEFGRVGPWSVLDIAWAVVPPALFVGTVGLLGSIVGRHYVAGLGAGLLVWGLNLLRPAVFGKSLYLFQLSRPLPGPALWENRLALSAGALLLLFASAAIWNRRERSLR